MKTGTEKGNIIPENLSEKVYSDLKFKLIIGKLSPGEPLSIRTLAEEYGVSAMPVREALRQLASEDILIGAAKKAYRVPDLSPKEAANLFFLRAVLEGAAAEIASNHVREVDLKALARYTVDLEKACKSGDVCELLLSNYRFHDRIYRLSDNEALQSMIYTLYARTGPWLAHGIVNLVQRDYWMADHALIVDALRNRDSAEVRRLVEEDSGWGMKVYQNLKDIA